MDYLSQVQAGVDYIEANLDFDIELRGVAKRAGISQWHFQRIFKALTGETLKAYIRSRRLANALGKLCSSNTRILEIASSAGFESQASFTRAFKKAFGMTPNEYRKIGENSLFLRKVQINADYLRHINQRISLQPEIQKQSEMLLVGMATTFYSVDSEKNNIATKLPSLWRAFLPRLSEVKHAVPGVCYGVIRQTGERSDLLEYYAATEVIAASPPEGMQLLVVPGQTYARFAHRGPVSDIDHTVNYIYSSWLAQSGERHSYGADLEIYGADYDAESDASIMPYAVPIR